jgi:hypothetical protein
MSQESDNLTKAVTELETAVQAIMSMPKDPDPNVQAAVQSAAVKVEALAKQLAPVSPLGKR